MNEFEEAKSSYYPNSETGDRKTLSVYERLLMELNNKNYYDQYQMSVYLSENGLNADDTFDKDKHYRKLLCTVLDVLESLCNNIDLFRAVETEFATTTEAYNYLERRIQKLKQRINEVPDEPVDGGRDGCFTHIFVD